jgi:branched-chain amino acid transport system ATP-binding protein
MLMLNEVTVERGPATVLRGVSLTVRPGEIVALLGSNGVGKTTTLWTISGLLVAKGGSITFEGASITRSSPAAIVRFGIAQIPEGRQVFPALTVRENLELGAYLRPRGWEVDLDRVLELFPMLRRDLHRRAGSLSGGQQQMLAIGRGLMSRPKLLMLDEPSIGLAPVAVSAMAEALVAIRAQAAVLLVEQNVGMALSVADRGYVMAGGRIVLEGTALELRHNQSVRQAYLGI